MNETYKGRGEGRSTHHSNRVWLRNWFAGLGDTESLP